MKIGILGLQGDYAKHGEILDQLGLESEIVRYPWQLTECNGLIIPGGESTAMTKIIRANGFRQPLLEFAAQNPVLGTCAGMILMGQPIGDDRVETLGLMDISVSRNAYGRQIFSFTDSLPVQLNGHPENISATFIRAPQIVSYGPEVEVIAEYDKHPVAVRQGKHIALAFHPELDNVSIFHKSAFIGN